MLRVANLRMDQVARWSETGETTSPFPFGFADRYAEAYRLELDHFADVMEGKVAPRTGFVASRDAIRLADAAERSIHTEAPVFLGVGAMQDA
jgi:myo-inositol 2-dehydrogenase/D-chiro-inositol 1-dehydrogenase